MIKSFSFPVLLILAWLLATPAAVADDYSFEFDVSAYKDKPFEYNGYFEILAEHLNLNRESVLYRLAYAGETQRSVLNRLTGSLELESLYRWDSTRFTLALDWSVLSSL